MTHRERTYVSVCPNCSSSDARDITKDGDAGHVFHCQSCNATWTET